MIILAKDSQSKGQQLERLTLRLLEKKGFLHCVSNVMANGSEIDVRAEAPLPGLIGSRSQIVLCECKAHAKPIDITVWCKFLGKLYHEEKVSRQEPFGYFIALSGVNGHVQGNYHELRRANGGIELLHGDDLLAVIRELYRFISLDEAGERIRAITTRDVSAFHPAYHEEKLYCIVAFSSGDFAILQASGDLADTDTAELLSPLIKSELGLLDCVDICGETRVETRKKIAVESVIEQVMLRGGTTRAPFIEVRFEDNVLPTITPDELIDTAKSLVAESVINSDENGQFVIPWHERGGHAFISDEVYRRLLSGPYSMAVIGCKMYADGISHGLVKRICEIHPGLTEELMDIDEIVELLQLSPNALRYALKPDVMLGTSEQYGLPITDEMKRWNVESFRTTLFHHLRTDFRTLRMWGFYFHAKDLIGLEIKTQYSLRFIGKRVRNGEVIENTYMIKVREEGLGQVTGFEIPELDDVLELGERWGKEHTKKTSAPQER